jgi:hypothetical protein
MISDYCLMSNEQLFSFIMVRTSYIRWDDVFVLEQDALLDCFSASSLKEQYAGRPIELNKFWCATF